MSPAVSEAQNYYSQARTFDENWQMRLAELDYKKAYETLKSNPSQNWALYGDAAYRYAFLINQRGDMEASLAVVNKLLSENIHVSERSALLLLMGECQIRLGHKEAAKLTFEKAYKTSVEAANGEKKGDFNMMVACINIFKSFMEMRDYKGAEKWLKRFDEEFDAYEHSDKSSSMLIEEYKGHVALCRATLLRAKGRTAEADAIFDAIPDSRIYNPISITNAAQYLMSAGRYAEAADMYARLDTTFVAIDSTHITFDKISECIAPRYMANRRAGIKEDSKPIKGRTAEALRMADTLCSAIDSALVWQKRNDAAELAVIYQTHEKELALKETQIKNTIYLIVTATALLLLILVVYFHWRIRRYNGLLKEKNRFLYKYISKREKAEEEESNYQQTQPTENLSNNQHLYRRLCEILRNPEVYTNADTNHETLARLAGTNYKYVYDALRECAEMTPADFINQHRIRHAAHLLANTDDPVGLVAEQCGITNRSTFARLFREQYSMTPTEYRKASRQ